MSMRDGIMYSRSNRTAKEAIKRSIRRLGFELVRGGGNLSEIRRHLLSEDVDSVFDVGANEGQYASLLRSSGYEGAIHSFEPSEHAYETLRRRSRQSPRAWWTEKVALGSAVGQGSLNVAANLVSSSLLEATGVHISAAPSSVAAHTEVVSVEQLDSFEGRLKPEDRLFLKLDVQGYELEVRPGAPKILARACAIQMQLSTVPLYRGQSGYLETLTRLDRSGYRIRAHWSQGSPTREPATCCSLTLYAFENLPAHRRLQACSHNERRPRRDPKRRET